MKTISIFLALVNALLAGLLISFLVTSMDFRISAIPIRPGILLLGSLFLVAIGPATAVWTFHRALLTGDMEYYMFMYGGSLFVQGIALLLGIPEGRSNASTAEAGR